VTLMTRHEALKSTDWQLTSGGHPPLRMCSSNFEFQINHCYNTRTGSVAKKVETCNNVHITRTEKNIGVRWGWISKVSPMPSTSRQTRLQPAVDEAKAMPSVFGHREMVTPEVSDCERAYEGRASERSPQLVGCVELLPMARFE